MIDLSAMTVCLCPPAGGRQRAADSGPVRSIRDLDLSAQRTFVRVDFNVPMDGGAVADDTRIRAALPTVRLAIENGSRTVLASHMGRPGGERVEELSLRPVARHLEGILDRRIAFAGDCVGEEAEAASRRLADGEVLLLENLRFHAGETANDEGFARSLAALADLYVNDAFGTAHRAHASTVGVPAELGGGAAGLLMEKEIECLGRVLNGAKRPVVALFGGAKVSDKMAVIRRFLEIADAVLIGGGMAFTFLKAAGGSVGNSLVEEDRLEMAQQLRSEARNRDVDLRLPADVVCARRIEADARTRLAPADEIPDGWMGLDIGPQTSDDFRRVLGSAATVIWNGPVGVFEVEPFAAGTLAMAQAVAASGAFSVIGGGDSVMAVQQAGVADHISHISTGGGASLQFLAGEPLPGMQALTRLATER